MNKYLNLGIIAIFIVALTACETAVDTNGEMPNKDTKQNAFYEDLLKVDTPIPNAEIISPITVTGKARGQWYFEASFPVSLYDANDNLLAQVPAQAQGDWMTEEYVPFKATLEFKATTQTGTLVLQNDNPSGLAEQVKALRIPVRFAKTTDTNISLFYYNPDLDQGPGGAQCTQNGLVAVDRTIPLTQTPLKDSIELLLQGDLTDAEIAQGITTEFPLDGFDLENVTINDGVATLTFNDSENQTIGGSCRVGILWFQIEATAKQFPTVDSVKFEPEDLFQP